MKKLKLVFQDSFFDKLLFIFLPILMLFFASAAFAQLPRYYRQQPKNNEGDLMTVNMYFGGHNTAGDLSDRFGDHASAGLGLDYITAKGFIMGVQGSFYFGTKVREDVIAGLRNESGLIFGNLGGIADIQLRQRGLYVGGHVGKLFRLKKELRSGIRATAGAGFYQHKIRIQDDPLVSVALLSSEYKKGYDRLSNGLGFTQFVGYQYLGKIRRVNFLVGLELTEGFTKNRRNFNFDTRSADTKTRFDFAYGFRVAWLLPFYIGEEGESIRY
ncbi:MAG TPA: hypothetical protein ENJ95_11005 [Bacteroidetes bacterium]|nr:hypothetical protein [Bacteroidota bacterium]